jgi:hypothetical protein
MQPDVTLDTVETARSTRTRPRPGKVCFILAAGNFSASGPSDALHKLFVDGEVCVIKMNPVNEHLGPFIERALTPFVREGFVRVVYGGVEAGQHLTNHPLVDTIHMTASDKTHDAVVFGVGEEGAKRKAANEPVITKPVTSELGAINPVIIVPGPWGDADIDYHGQAPRVDAGDERRVHVPVPPRDHPAPGLGPAATTCSTRSGRHSPRAPQRNPYYPGARERWELFLAAHPEAETYGDAERRAVPWTLIPNLDPTRPDDIAFKTEAFNGVFTEGPLWTAPMGDYLDRAVDFCNDRLWGTLSARSSCTRRR